MWFVMKIYYWKLWLLNIFNILCPETRTSVQLRDTLQVVGHRAQNKKSRGCHGNERTPICYKCFGRRRNLPKRGNGGKFNESLPFNGGDLFIDAFDPKKGGYGECGTG